MESPEMESTGYRDNIVKLKSKSYGNHTILRIVVSNLLKDII